MTISDIVVVQVMDRGRTPLLACVRRAQQRDPGVVPPRIDVQLEIDPSGTVTSARVELEDARLNGCLVRAARSLHFPAPGKDARAALAFIAP